MHQTRKSLHLVFCGYTENMPVRACDICGAEYEYRTNGRPKLVCSIPCKNEKERRRQLASRPDIVRKCEVCLVEFVTRNPKSFACSPECQRERIREYGKRKWVERKATRPQFKEWICAWCEQPVVVPVSLSGNRKYHDHCKVQATRAKNRKKSVKRQGAKTQKTILHETIAQRDGYVCHICGDAVDMSLPRRSHMGATLDHVIPIAKGGLDCEDNVKLAHWICNVRKSDKLEVHDA